MKELILLYWGTVFFSYLSAVYYPNVRDKTNRIEKRYLRRKSDMFMIIVIIWMTCFSFLRTRYNDTFQYIILFEEAIPVREGFSTGAFLQLAGNPGSLLYRSIIHDLTDNYHIYFLFPALMSSFAVIKLFKHYSVDPAFSLLIFFSIGTYVMFIAALKQSMAMFFLLMALPYALEKKYIRFYLLVIVAILFHTHAFLFAIVPFLTEKPWSKVTWMLLAAMLFAMATYDETLGAFMEFAQSIGATVAEREVFDGHSINILRVLVYWIPALLALFFRRTLFQNSTKVENLFANMSIASALILTIGLREGANLYARMAAYFEIGTAISIPWMINKIFTKQSAQFLTVLASALYFIYFLYEFAVAKDFGSTYSAISFWEFVVSLLV